MQHLTKIRPKSGNFKFCLVFIKVNIVTSVLEIARLHNHRPPPPTPSSHSLSFAFQGVLPPSFRPKLLFECPLRITSTMEYKIFFFIQIPVDTQRRFNVYKTSGTLYRRLIYVETTSCLCWIVQTIQTSSSDRLSGRHAQSRVPDIFYRALSRYRLLF